MAWNRSSCMITLDKGVSSLLKMYMIQSIGIKKKSIFLSNFFSSSVPGTYSRRACCSSRS